MKKTTSHYRRILSLWVFGLFLSHGYAQFTPGSGGDLPVFANFEQIPNKFGGFVVNKSSRENNFWGDGTRAVVDMSFPPPSSIGAESYTLQYSSDDGLNWFNFQYDSKDLTTVGDNFSLYLTGNYKFRVLANGGEKNGYTSNERYAPLSAVPTYFAGWSLDESMYLSGVMSPFVGRGLEAGFTVKNLSDQSIVSTGMAYQWYRVNPLTFDLTPIEGATGLRYITTAEDVGYNLALKATGDEVSVGGFSWVMSSGKVIYSNPCFVDHVTTNGFRLNLLKSVGVLDTNTLHLFNKNFGTVPITSISQVQNGAVFDLQANLNLDDGPYYLMGNNRFWTVTTEFEGGMMIMEGVNFNFPTGLNDVNASTPIVYDMQTRALKLDTQGSIKCIAIFNASGVMVYYKKMISGGSEIRLSSLSGGYYLIRLYTDQGELSMPFVLR